MSSTSLAALASFREQLRAIKPPGAVAYRLALKRGSGDDLFFPGLQEAPCPIIPVPDIPAGLSPGRFRAEFYDANNKPLSGSFADVTYGLPAEPPKSDEVKSSPPAAKSDQDVQQQEEDPMEAEFRNYKILPAYVREMSQGLRELRSFAKQMALDVEEMHARRHRQQVEDQLQMLATLKGQLAQAESEKARVDYVKLGVALIQCIQTIVQASIGSPMSKGQGTRPRTQDGSTQIREPNDADGEESERLDPQALDQLLHLANPVNIEKVLGDPEERALFTRQLAQILKKGAP